MAHHLPNLPQYSYRQHLDSHSRLTVFPGRFHALRHFVVSCDLDPRKINVGVLAILRIKLTCLVIEIPQVKTIFAAFEGMPNAARM